MTLSSSFSFHLTFTVFSFRCIETVKFTDTEICCRNALIVMQPRQDKLPQTGQTWLDSDRTINQSAMAAGVETFLDGRFRIRRRVLWHCIFFIIEEVVISNCTPSPVIQSFRLQLLKFNFVRLFAQQTLEAMNGKNNNSNMKLSS